MNPNQSSSSDVGVYENTIIRKDGVQWNRCRNPPAYADTRSELIEATPWFRNHQAGYYSLPVQVNGKRLPMCRGLLLAGHSGGITYMDAEVLIVGINGASSTNTSETQRRQQSMSNAIQHRALVGVIVDRRASVRGEGSTEAPLFPCNNMFARPSTWVTDWWLPIEMWPVKVLKEKGNTDTPRTARPGAIWQVKLEKWDLATQSWWANPQNPPPPSLQHRNFSKRSKSEKCKACTKKSCRLFNELFLCLNIDCTHHWCTVDGTPVDESQQLTYTNEFLTERSDRTKACFWPENWPQLYEDFQFWHAQEYFKVQTTMLNRNNFKGIMQTLLRGFRCPYCNLVNRRFKWHEWTCRNLDGCNNQQPFSLPGYPPILTVQQSSVFNTIDMPDFSRLNYYSKSWLSSNGWYHIHQFDLGTGCEVFYLEPLPNTTAQGHGADYFYDRIQRLAKEGRIHLERRSIATQAGHQRTGHFADNFGEPYYLAVAIGTTAWDKAPTEIEQARYEANIITRDFRKADEPEYNELYIAGYWQGQAMNWHDDGEHGLDQKILTWSLGGQGTFSFRLKPRIKYGRSMPRRGTAGNTFITDDPVLRGSVEYEARKDLKEQLDSGAISQSQWQTQFEQLMRQHPRQSTAQEVVLSFPVNHGSIVLMNGVNMQRYYDHSVNVQDSPLRFALTFRHITPRHQLQGNVARIQQRLVYDQRFTPDDGWNSVFLQHPSSLDPPALSDIDMGEADPTIGEPAPGNDDPDETDEEPEPQIRPIGPVSVGRRRGGRQRRNIQRAAITPSGDETARRSTRRQPKRGC